MERSFPRQHAAVLARRCRRTPEFAARLAGSGDLFDRHARRPWASINYAASHDGFTLADVVSFAQRHNEANGEDNKDGHGGELFRQLGR